MTIDKPIIDVSNLTKRFGDFTAVDDISFQVGQGEIFGFLGANGAGKTTAIKMLNGLSKPTSGKAQVGGYDVLRYPEAVKQNIGYMSQKFSLYEDLTVKENIQFYAGIYKLSRIKIREKIEELIQTLNLKDIKDELISGLPLGFRQKLAFSVAIIHEPKIVFLDEPTSGVDPITRRQFWTSIYEAANRGITIFVTTHYMDESEYCDRVSIMVEGKIEALDRPAALKKHFNAASMDDVFVKLTR